MKQTKMHRARYSTEHRAHAYNKRMEQNSARTLIRQWVLTIVGVLALGIGVGALGLWLATINLALVYALTLSLIIYGGWHGYRSSK